MAKKISITTQLNDAENAITRTFQSGNINFLLGSGASLPAISTAGNTATATRTVYVGHDGSGNTDDLTSAEGPGEPRTSDETDEGLTSSEKDESTTTTTASSTPWSGNASTNEDTDSSAASEEETTSDQEDQTASTTPTS